MAFRMKKKMFISISFGPINLTKSYYRVCIFTENIRVRGLFSKEGILKAIFFGALKFFEGRVIIKKDFGGNIRGKNKNICDNFKIHKNENLSEIFIFFLQISFPLPRNT